MNPNQEQKLKQKLLNVLKERDELFLYDNALPILLDGNLRKKRYKEFEKVIHLVFSGKWKIDYELDEIQTVRNVQEAMIKGYTVLISSYVKDNTDVSYINYAEYLYNYLRRIETDELFEEIVQLELDRKHSFDTRQNLS